MIKIRKFTISDLPQVKLLQPDGWPDITANFSFFNDVDFCFPFVGEVGTEIVGLANCLLNEDSGWISHIIVSERFRNQGFGYKLTQHVMNFLSDKNISTQLLIATQMGEKLYEKLGFKKSALYNFYKGEKLTCSKNENIRSVKSSDFDDILKLDYSISGEYRKNMLQHYISSGFVYEENKSKILSGYYIPELGDGVILASNENAGIELLKFKHSQKVCKTILPELNHTGNKILKESGFEIYNQSYRMVYGEEVNWKPKSVYCRIGGYYA